MEGVATRTVGRDLELRRLQDWFTEVVDEQAWRTVTVIGEAGVGKSRLLFELDHWLAGLPDGVWVLRARASAANTIAPYSLLRELFANRFEIHDSDPPALVAEKWLAGMRSDDQAADEHALVTAAWLGFEIGDDNATLTRLRDDAQSLSELGATALEAFLRRLVDQAPLVLELEDLHWADEASLNWLERAAGTAGRGARAGGGHGPADPARGPPPLGRGARPSRPPGTGAAVTRGGVCSCSRRSSSAPTRCPRRWPIWW